MYGLLSSKQAAGDGKARRAAIGACHLTRMAGGGPAHPWPPPKLRRGRHQERGDAVAAGGSWARGGEPRADERDSVPAQLRVRVRREQPGRHLGEPAGLHDLRGASRHPHPRGAARHGAGGWRVSLWRRGARVHVLARRPHLLVTRPTYLAGGREGVLLPYHLPPPPSEPSCALRSPLLSLSSCILCRQRPATPLPTGAVSCRPPPNRRRRRRPFPQLPSSSVHPLYSEYAGAAMARLSYPSVAYVTTATMHATHANPSWFRVTRPRLDRACATPRHHLRHLRHEPAAGWDSPSCGNRGKISIDAVEQYRIVTCDRPHLSLCVCHSFFR
ncbi:hypothetical protein EMIHUDRAFT_441526 [Emiliania huxleyi CCMP1516]|uniref:Uncharacterized protein n=2 Tax=Emiliania huxleyi TaxID=2903 RepID=A0A0D3KCT2_EMIH1|nr:hypothetical protein EMIHUDRAFT_441526 [Emiliania huxleyi CCMP1516]EOD33567.1 hypothetical protein EMIHUDRAFT_441526 [Emiliania huxleyi CCMP1516]|eukprot:XP_005785996.1 hypothetical protein EMIHUDRAFT_441526 [Emiliania huxleyi CCMP1516]